MKRFILSSLLILLLGASTACAQQFLYDVDFVMDFDNHESNNTYEKSGTIFGFRLTPSIGVGLSDSLGGSHRLMGGVSYIQPCGANWKQVQVVPTVYYEYAMRGFQMGFGFVPYSLLIEALPDYLRSDSLAFYYPNIQGALFQYQSRHGHAMLMCDWRGMMSHETREAFRIIGGGKYQYQWFMAGGWVQMNHLSHNADTILGVCDDIVLNPLVGVNVGQYTPLDSLSLQIGYLGGLQRDRRYDRQYWVNGMVAELYLGWRFIGFRNSLYWGDDQMPLYSHYGSLLNQGDPRFRASLFNRTDLFFYIVRRSFVTCYAGWSLIVTDHGTISNQQQVVCRFNLDGLLRHPQKKQIRTLNWR